MSNIYLLLVLAAGIFEAFLVFRAFREWFLEAIFEQSGIIVDARIVKSERKVHKYERNRSITYHVTYRFEREKVHYERVQEISEKNFRRLYPGVFVAVGYLPEKPTVSRLAGKDRDNTQRNFASWYILYGACVLIFLLVLGPGNSTR